MLTEKEIENRKEEYAAAIGRYLHRNEAVTRDCFCVF